jgi:hypothetical protein
MNASVPTHTFSSVTNKFLQTIETDTNKKNKKSHSPVFIKGEKIVIKVFHKDQISRS